ncbi:DegT/DnrJ/EryC1/StrS family aminotransferase [Bacillus songklensis]|uniref:DegT/DnrJ/EryC1/StrS family aminotransferase n=1 Tax=Bacillus songklensis TaxID=1069116 RepID=A0ABV8B2X6_9BACI
MNSFQKRIYLSPPHMGGHEKEFVEKAFADNWIAPLGPNVDSFERELADYVKVQGALALSSGTAAIHLALRLLEVGAGDWVFCSSLTFVASANPILYQGAVPVFIDSEPESWNMSPGALKQALKEAAFDGKLPKAVIVVNLYGQSADMATIIEICDQYRIPVIEDAAESLGATYKGKASGTLGRFGIYSFNGNKIITTSGGGMLVSDDLESLEKARFWATQARDAAKHYQHSDLGYNYRLSNILAGIGRGQLKVLEKRVEARRSNFNHYFSRLSDIDGIDFMPESVHGKSTRWLTALTIDPIKCGISAPQLVELLEKQNIEARAVWKPMHLQPLYQNFSYYPHQPDQSISGELFEKGICLPSGSNLTSTDRERVIECIRGIVKGPGK